MNRVPVSIDELVSWQPVASLLQLHERAFWRAVHEQGLPHYRINSRVLRFRLSEVEQWLAARRKGDI